MHTLTIKDRLGQGDKFKVLFLKCSPCVHDGVDAKGTRASVPYIQIGVSKLQYTLCPILSSV
jgi:hypothetical protein